MCVGKENCECGCNTVITKDVMPINSRQITDEGFLMAKVTLARTGIQDYKAFELGLTDRNPDEIVKVYRPDEEVFNQDSMKSFEGKPVTNEHPPELVTVDNIGNYQIGYITKEVNKEGDHLLTEIVVTDKTAIAAVQSGKTQVSNGYLSKLDLTPGTTPEGEQYDAIQREIRGNHVAIVGTGRCGDSCRILDSKGGAKMKDFIFDNKIIKVDDESSGTMEKMQKKLDEMSEKLKAKDEELEKLKKENGETKKTNDSLTAQVDELKANQVNAEQLDSLVEQRMQVIDTAKKVIKDFDYTGKTALDIKKAVIAAKHSGISLDSKSEDYINARFDAINEMLESESSEQLSVAVGDALNGSGQTISARDAMLQRVQNMWRAN